MAVDDVELVGTVQDGAHRQVEVRRRVAAVAGRPERLGNGRDETPGHLRVAAGEGRQLMTPPIELADELDDDPLGAAVCLRRDALHRRRDLCDP